MEGIGGGGMCKGNRGRELEECDLWAQVRLFRGPFVPNFDSDDHKSLFYSDLAEKQLSANIKTSKGPRHLSSDEKMQGNTRLRN